MIGLKETEDPDMVVRKESSQIYCCRSPHGGRGLKHPLIGISHILQVVAPHTGGVD